MRRRKRLPDFKNEPGGCKIRPHEITPQIAKHLATAIIIEAIKTAGKENADLGMMQDPDDAIRFLTEPDPTSRLYGLDLWLEAMGIDDTDEVFRVLKSLHKKGKLNRFYLTKVRNSIKKKQ